MGKLNNLIKFVVFNANAILFFGGWGILSVAVVLLQADFIALAETYLQVRAVASILGGIFMVCLSVLGCVGTHRQVQRNRTWSGRRVLSLFQLLLLAMIIGQGIVLVQLYRIEVNLEEAVEGLPDEYGEVENRFRVGFNEAYFEHLCSNEGDDWIWSLVDEHCPSSISEDTCPCGQEVTASCSFAETYNLEDCCPDEELCEAGTDDSCPYTGCRTGVIELLLDFITPSLEYSIFALALEGGILILTCLLICYNPRDSTEDILVATGALKRKTSEALNLTQIAVEPPAAGLSGKAAQAKDYGNSAGQHYIVETTMAAMAKRGRGGQKEGIPELSTLALLPTTNDLPSEPLRQFMTPRKVGRKVAYGPDSPEGSPGKPSGSKQGFDNAEAFAATVSSSPLTEPGETEKNTAEQKKPAEAVTARADHPVAVEKTNGSDPHMVPQRGEGISDDSAPAAVSQQEAEEAGINCSSSAMTDGKNKPDQGAPELLDDLQPRGQPLVAEYKEWSEDSPGKPSGTEQEFDNAAGVAATVSLSALVESGETEKNTAEPEKPDEASAARAAHAVAVEKTNDGDPYMVPLHSEGSSEDPAPAAISQQEAEEAGKDCSSSAMTDGENKPNQGAPELLDDLQPRGQPLVADYKESSEDSPGKSSGTEQEFDNAAGVAATVSSSALAEPGETEKNTAEPEKPAEASAARAAHAVAVEKTNGGDPYMVPLHSEGSSEDPAPAAISQQEAEEAEKDCSSSAMTDGENKPDQGAPELLNDLQLRGQPLVGEYKERSEDSPGKSSGTEQEFDNAAGVAATVSSRALTESGETEKNTAEPEKPAEASAARAAHAVAVEKTNGGDSYMVPLHSEGSSEDPAPAAISQQEAEEAGKDCSSSAMTDGENKPDQGAPELLDDLQPRGQPLVADYKESSEDSPGKSSGTEQEFDNAAGVAATVSSSALAEPGETEKNTAEPEKPAEAAKVRAAHAIAVEKKNGGDPHMAPLHGEGSSDDSAPAAVSQQEAEEAGKSCSSSAMTDGENKPDQGEPELLDDLQPRGQPLVVEYKECSQDSHGKSSGTEQEFYKVAGVAATVSSSALAEPGETEKNTAEPEKPDDASAARAAHAVAVEKTNGGDSHMVPQYGEGINDDPAPAAVSQQEAEEAGKSCCSSAMTDGENKPDQGAPELLDDLHPRGQPLVVEYKERSRGKEKYEEPLPPKPSNATASATATSTEIVAFLPPCVNRDQSMSSISSSATQKSASSNDSTSTREAPILRSTSRPELDEDVSPEHVIPHQHDESSSVSALERPSPPGQTAIVTPPQPKLHGVQIEQGSTFDISGPAEEKVSASEALRVKDILLTTANDQASSPHQPALPNLSTTATKPVETGIGEDSNVQLLRQTTSKALSPTELPSIGDVPNATECSRALVQAQTEGLREEERSQVSAQEEATIMTASTSQRETNSSPMSDSPGSSQTESPAAAEGLELPTTVSPAAPPDATTVEATIQQELPGEVSSKLDDGGGRKGLGKATLDSHGLVLLTEDDDASACASIGETSTPVDESHGAPVGRTCSQRFPQASGDAREQSRLPGSPAQQDMSPAHISSPILHAPSLVDGEKGSSVAGEAISVPTNTDALLVEDIIVETPSASPIIASTTSLESSLLAIPDGYTAEVPAGASEEPLPAPATTEESPAATIATVGDGDGDEGSGDRIDGMISFHAPSTTSGSASSE